MIKTAIISDCGKYRYQLTRVWDATKPLALYVMLNPSTADADINDPTIRRLIAFTRMRGLGGFYVCNAYAYRTPSPEEMFKAEKQGIDIKGPENTLHLNLSVEECDIIVMAWGNDGPDTKNFEAWAERRGKPLYSFGRTKSGKPLHPLYLERNTPFALENTFALTYKFPEKDEPKELFK